MRIPLLAAAIVAALLGSPVHAVQRAFVSVQGNDANAGAGCSLAKPCRSFAAAAGVTDVNGEVLVLDSGGYGAVTLTKGVTLSAPAGVHGGVTAWAGTAAVSVNAPGATVRLHGLALQGMGADRGIDVVAVGRLVVESCDVAAFKAQGLYYAGSGGEILVRDTAFRDGDHQGIELWGIGTPVNLVVDRGRFWHNGPIGSGAGLYLNGAVVATLRDSLVSRNGSGLIAGASNAGALSIQIANSAVTQNDSSGILLGSFGNTLAALTVADTTVADNGSSGIGTWSGSDVSPVSLEVSRAVVARHGGYGISVVSDYGAPSNALLADSVFSDNGAAVVARGAGASVSVVRNAMLHNGTGLQQASGATLRSAGDNVIESSTVAPTTGTITPIGALY